MKIQEAFVDALIEEAFYELPTGPASLNHRYALDLLIQWAEDMEYDRPRNHAEKVLFEHLDSAIDRVSQNIKRLQTV